MAWFSEIAHVLGEHRYLALFVGMILGGESVFLPAVYLTVLGIFRIVPLILIAGAGTIVADSIWYLVGWHVPLARLEKLKIIAKQRSLVEKFTARFDRHSLKFLYASKFIYGTRILAQIFCGVRRVPFLKYFFVNLLGAFSLLLLLTGSGFAVGVSVEAIDNTVKRAEILLLIFVAIILAFQIGSRLFVKKRWLR